MSQYCRNNNHHAKRTEKRKEKKKEPEVIHRNMRAERIKLKRDCATDDAVMLAYDQLYRTQLLNQIAHERKLPVVKIKKEKLLASIHRRLTLEKAKIEKELRGIINISPRLA